MGCGISKQVEKATARRAPSLPAALQQNNEDIRDKYELGDILGSGSFGQVRAATLRNVPNHEVRAVKMIERDGEDGEWSNQAIFVREVGLLQQICHENIIRYYDFYEDVHFLYVVMELCRGGEVFTKILELKRFSEKHAAYLGRQMLRAIDYIHKINIVHRDIKAENFMLAESSITSTVKMIDFGMACKFEEGTNLTELCGSPHYLAPELIGQKYTQLADVWACGVLLYLLMYGHYPYDAKKPRDIMLKILTEPILWQTKVKLSNHALDFLKSALVHDPKKRVSAEEALGHPWLKVASPLSSLQDSDALPSEVLRSAHKKVTATRKQVDPKVDAQRNQKLKKIEEDFNKGVRLGKRLGETPNEEFMSKPEFVRRETKITTAPSRDLGKRRPSLNGLIATMSGSGNKVEKKPLDLDVITESNCVDDSLQPMLGRKKGRSASCHSPRRLSYIGSLSDQDEKNLAKIYEDRRKEPMSFSGVVPELQTELPGTSPEEELAAKS